jgi:hypothetical protein
MRSQKTAVWIASLSLILSCASCENKAASPLKSGPVEGNQSANADSSGNKAIAASFGQAQPYEIIEIKKLDIGAVVGSLNDPRNENPPRVGRRSIRVVVAPTISREDLDATLKKVAADEAQKEPTVDEIGVFAYGRKGDANGSYTYGKIDWAPGGKWGSTTPDIARSHDRSSYRYSIDITPRVGKSLVGGPSPREYEIYDAVDSKLQSDFDKNINQSNPEEAAYAFVASAKKLSKKEVQDAYTKVLYYNQSP